MHLDPSIPPVEVTEAPKRRGLLSIFSGAKLGGFLLLGQQAWINEKPMENKYGK